MDSGSGGQRRLTAAAPLRRPTALISRGARESRVKQLLVVDDQRTFAEALACRLSAEPGLNAFAATTVQQAQWVMAEHQVDAVLLDIDLGGDDAIGFAGEVLAQHPAVRIVVVTAGEDDSRIVEAVCAGVSGWVVKDEAIEHLLAVIRGSLAGETWIPPRLLTHVLGELRAAQRGRAELELLIGTLTKREQEVLCCLASGMSRDAIADQLYLSRNTVRTHIQNLLGKLDVHSTLAAVALARRAGLTSPGARRRQSVAPLGPVGGTRLT